VIAAFLVWQRWVVAAVITGIVIAQLPLQRRFLQQPAERYLKFSAIGVSVFVWGMMIAAIGVQTLKP
jgi:chlorophyll synthase